MTRGRQLPGGSREVTLTIGPTLLRELDDVAASSGMTRSDCVRRALRLWLDSDLSDIAAELPDDVRSAPVVPHRPIAMSDGRWMARVPPELLDDAIELVMRPVLQPGDGIIVGKTRDYQYVLGGPGLETRHLTQWERRLHGPQ